MKMKKNYDTLESIAILKLQGHPIARPLVGMLGDVQLSVGM
jgi:hypothetical protein